MKKKILLFVLSMVCLAALLGVVFVANADETPETAIAGHNLSLDDSVQIIYYVYQVAPEGAEVGVLCWFDPQESYTLANAQYKLKQNGTRTISGKEYAQYNFPYIAAKMYTQDVYAVSYVKMGEEVTYGNLDKYSVLQYCQNKKNSGSALGNLVDQILDYGAAAQVYFNFNVDRLANADYYQISVKNGVLADGTTEGLFVSGSSAVLTASMTAEEGYEIIWKNSADEIVGEGETLTVFAEGNETYTASLIALEHIYGEWIVDEAPTCTAAGSRHKTCTDCGDTVTEEIPATGHSFGEWQAVTSQSCTSGGIEVRTCATCGTYEQRTYPAPGHQFGDWTVTKEVTCTENGERTRTCAVCGILQRETIWSQGHQYGDWVTVKPATCEKGLQERTCAVCGNIEKKVLPADYTLHIWGEDSCTVCGEHKASEGLQYELLDDGNIAICGYTGSDTTIYLPSSFYGSVVTTIKAEAFKDQAQITEIVIPESITSVDSAAFSGCTNIQSATMPTWAISAAPKGKLKTVVLNSGTSIGYEAFRNCTSLTSVTIPDSVTSIGEYAFSYCTSLTSVTIPDSVMGIGDFAFSSCHLTSVTIPDSVTSIGKYAFGWCTSLTSVTIGNSVTSIANSAFSNCYRLVEVHNLSALPITSESLDYGYVGFYAKHIYKDGESYLYTTDDGFVFYDDGTNVYLVQYNGTETDLTLPKNYNGKFYAINQYAFYDSYNLTNIIIPDSVTSIEHYAFQNCNTLTNVTIGNGVTSIGAYAFSCTALTSITVPDSVTSIGYNAFEYCASLQYNVYDNAKYLGNANNPYVVLMEATDTSITSCNIHLDTKVIYDSAFSNCYNLTSVTVPDSVASIGYQAFYRCTSLTNVTIPDSVTELGGHAFSGCSSLTEIIFLGTAEEWNAISKGYYWNRSTGDYVIHCTDGDIAESGTPEDDGGWSVVC